MLPYFRKNRNVCWQIPMLCPLFLSRVAQKMQMTAAVILTKSQNTRTKTSATAPPTDLTWAGSCSNPGRCGDTLPKTMRGLEDRQSFKFYIYIYINPVPSSHRQQCVSIFKDKHFNVRSLIASLLTVRIK